MGLNNLSLIGANPTTGSSTAWGMVPQVPDPLSTAATAVGGNLANLGGLTDLASRVNAFNTQQAVNPYIANLPGYQSMVNQSSGNIGSLLQGQIPADVLNLLGQRSAERGIGTGLAGSPNANSAAMQALGLTSLGLQQQGEGELTQAIGRTPTAPLFNVAQFLTTPGEEQAAQLAANIYRSAPDPQKQAQALIDLFTRFMGRLGQGQNAAPFVIPSGSGPSPYTGGNNAAGGGTPMPPGGGVLSRPATGLTGNRNPGAAPGQFGGFQGPLINPLTGASTPFQGTGPINPWTGATNQFQGPSINPFTGSSTGLFSGPNIDPWTGQTGAMQGPMINPTTGYFSGGFQGPNIDPFTGSTNLFSGPNIDPFSGQTTGLFQGPNIDPLTGHTTGLFQGPNINPFTGQTVGLEPPQLTQQQIQEIIDMGLLPGESPEDFIG